MRSNCGNQLDECPVLADGLQEARLSWTPRTPLGEQHEIFPLASMVRRATESLSLIKIALAPRLMVRAPKGPHRNARPKGQ
jgi:hypothetical protein